MPAKGKRFHLREFLTNEYVDNLLNEIKGNSIYKTFVNQRIIL